MKLQAPWYFAQKFTRAEEWQLKQELGLFRRGYGRDAYTTVLTPFLVTGCVAVSHHSQPITRSVLIRVSPPAAAYVELRGTAYGRVKGFNGSRIGLYRARSRF